MSVTYLAKKALCVDDADYEGLLANISLIRNIVDCEGGKISQSGSSLEILSKLFGQSDANVQWFGCVGTSTNAPSSTVNTTVSSLSLDCIEFQSCFSGLNISYYTGFCDASCTRIDSVKFVPRLSACDVETINYLFPTDLSVVDSSVVDYYISFVNAVYPDANVIDLADLEAFVESSDKYVFTLNLVAAFLGGWLYAYDGGNIIVDPVKVNDADVDDVLAVLELLCHLIVQRIEMKRYLRKTALTISDCEI